MANPSISSDQLMCLWSNFLAGPHHHSSLCLMVFLSGILPGIRGEFPHCSGSSDLSNFMFRGISTPHPLLQCLIMITIKTRIWIITNKDIIYISLNQKAYSLKHSMREGMGYHLSRMAKKGESNKTVKCPYQDYLNIHILPNLYLSVHIFFNN